MLCGDRVAVGIEISNGAGQSAEYSKWVLKYRVLSLYLGFFLNYFCNCVLQGLTKMVVKNCRVLGTSSTQDVNWVLILNTFVELYIRP